jgi:hypothetical protein
MSGNPLKLFRARGLCSQPLLANALPKPALFSLAQHGEKRSALLNQNASLYFFGLRSGRFIGKRRAIGELDSEGVRFYPEHLALSRFGIPIDIQDELIRDIGDRDAGDFHPAI